MNRIAASARRIGRVLERRRTVWYILAFAIVLRLILLAAVGGIPLSNDMKSYHTVALRIVEGDRYSPDWPPGLPYYLAAFQYLFGAREIVSRVAALIAGIAMLLLFHRLAARTVSLRAANLLLLIFAVTPEFLFHSVEPLTQIPAALCLLGIVAILRREARPRGWTGVALGALLAFSVLIRPSSTLVAVFILVAIALRWRSPGVVMLPVATLALLVSAWLWMAHGLAGHWVFINHYNNANLFYGNNPYTPMYRTWWLGSHGAGEEGVPAAYTRLIASIDSLPPDERDRRFREEALAHIADRPDLFLVRSLSRFRSYLAFDTFPGSFVRTGYHVPGAAGLGVIAVDALLYMLIVAAALGAAVTHAARHVPRQTTRLLGGLLFCYAAPYWLSFAHPSYHTPLLPLVALFAAAAAERLFEHGPRAMFTRLSPGRRAALIALLALFVIIQIEWIAMMIGRA
jgi:4-amino-4-deoxy-L-arabinose transferase-like glycosyltransferase